MTDSDARIEYLRKQFEQYVALSRHHADADFLDRLEALQQWEKKDIERRHALACDDNPHYATVMSYYLDALHGGMDLRGTIEKGPDSIENARRLNKAYQLFANAIEYSVLSARQEERMVEALGDTAITASSYAAALKQCDDLEQRIRRLDLLVEIGHEVAPHIGSRIIHTGFKLLKGVFRSSGMSAIHETLDQGFKRLRGVPRLAQILAEIADTERQHLESCR